MDFENFNQQAQNISDDNLFKNKDGKAMIDLQISEPLEGTSKRIATTLKKWS